MRLKQVRTPVVDWFYPSEASALYPDEPPRWIHDTVFFPGKVCILTPTSIVRVPVSTHLYSTLITMMSIFIIFPVKNNMSPAVGTFQGLCASSTRCDAYLPAGLHAGRHHYHQPGRAIGCKKSWELKQENRAKTSLKRWEIEKRTGMLQIVWTRRLLLDIT